GGRRSSCCATWRRRRDGTAPPRVERRQGGGFTMATMRDRGSAVHHFVVDTVGHLDWLPPLLARGALGVTFIQSGWGKLHNIPKVAAFFQSLGLPQPELQAHFVAGTEFVCGWLVLVGLFSRIASVPLVVTMLVAIVTAKADELKHYGDLFGFTEW